MAERKPGRISEISDEKKGENCDADGQCYHAGIQCRRRQ